MSTYRSFLWALARKTGRPIASFGTDGRIDLRDGLGQPAERLSVSASTPGVVFEDLLIMGSSVPETLPGSPGHIRAFDVNTGRLRWMFHTIPKPGEFGYDTWPKDAHRVSGGANAWAGVTVDAALGMVFAATGSASFDLAHQAATPLPDCSSSPPHLLSSSPLDWAFPSPNSDSQTNLFLSPSPLPPTAPTSPSP